MAEPDLDDIERRMDGALAALRREFAGLRTGRASAQLLEPMMVEAYGATMPITQLATVNVPEPRMLSVQVWDRGNVKAVERAIRVSDLGLNPQVDGQLLRIPLPDLSEERRRELTKVAGRYAEGARVAVRNVRRDGVESVRRLEKDGELSQDDRHLYEEEIQSLTDDHIGQIDQMLSTKETEIMHV
ncbi:MAG: ribosome recycling factor [Alphaproteobacteria bacterium]|nr:ribosome recycling factor [Alphaproteobacteria bacterium]